MCINTQHAEELRLNSGTEQGEKKSYPSLSSSREAWELAQAKTGEYQESYERLVPTSHPFYIV